MTTHLPPSQRPTERQIAYLKKLTGISHGLRLQRYVARKSGRTAPEAGGPPLTRTDYARAIDAELGARNWSRQRQAA